MVSKKKKEQLKLLFSIIKFLFLLIIVIGIPIFVYWYYPEFLRNFRSLEDINAYLDRYHTASIFIYIGLQILQIVVSVIPGQMLQFAAGYAYNFFLAYLVSIIGISLGTAATFYLARILGKDALHIIFGEDRINRFVTMLNKKRAYAVIFLLYLIPGFPKDLIGYAAGVSEMRFRPFLVLSLLGRTPALMATILMGGMTRTGSYTGMIVTACVVALACLICFFKRERIIACADSAYEKYTKPKQKKG